MSNTYSISELSKDFAITTRSIRFYEEKGLLTPKREGNNRIYSAADRVKLKLILRGKRLGFSLEESHDIIAMYQPNQGNQQQLHTLIKKIRDKRGQLEQQLSDIEAMMLDLKEAEQQCLNSLTATK